MSLDREYLEAAGRMADDAVRELTTSGVPQGAIKLVRPVLTTITLDPAGKLYWPDPAGKPAWVLPVRIADLAYPAEWIEVGDPEDIISRGPILDMIAFAPSRPGCWALRLGEAPVLGVIEPQYLHPGPVPVHRDVTDWLGAGCRGIVLLTDDQHEAGRILRHCTMLEAEDAAHKAELDRLIYLPPFVATTVRVRPRRAA
jgi:hypothetical protein